MKTLQKLLNKWGMVVLRWDGELTVVLPSGCYDVFGWKLDISMADIPSDAEVVSSNLIQAERDKFFWDEAEAVMRESKTKIIL